MRIPPQPIKALHGDERWTLVWPVSSYAPVVVLTLLGISFIQIALGAYWIARLDRDLAFTLVLQPLVLPCLSLFNTIPSAHLHLYSHFNNPHVSFYFSGIFAVLYFAAFLVAIIACTPSPPSLPALCSTSLSSGKFGPNVSESYWGATVGLWLISSVGYAVLTVMAIVVWRGFRRLERGDGALDGTANGGNIGGGDAALELRGAEAQPRTRGIGEGKRVRDWQEERLTDEQRAERLRKAEDKWKKVYGL